MISGISMTGWLFCLIGQGRETCHPPSMEMNLQKYFSGALFPSHASSPWLHNVTSSQTHALFPLYSIAKPEHFNLTNEPIYNSKHRGLMAGRMLSISGGLWRKLTVENQASTMLTAKKKNKWNKPPRPPSNSRATLYKALVVLLLDLVKNNG